MGVINPRHTDGARIKIDATPLTVYKLVSDMNCMGR